MTTFKSETSIEVHFLNLKADNLGLNCRYTEFYVEDFDSYFEVSTSSSVGTLKIYKHELEEDGFKPVIFWHNDRGEEPTLYYGLASFEDNDHFEMILSKDQNNYSDEIWFTRSEK